MRAFYETRHYPTNLKVWKKSYRNVHFVPHWHSEMELILVKNGKVQILIEGKSYIASEGDLIICDAGLVHSSTSKYVRNELDFLIFDNRLINFHRFNLNKPVIKKEFLINNNLFHLLINLFNEIELEINNQDTLYQDIIISLINNFCVKLYRKTNHLQKERKVSKYEEENILFEEVLDYMENNYQRNIQLEDVASIMNITGSYFSTLFKVRTNYNFTDYINIIRIENAIREINSSDKKFTEIAFNNGFNNLRTFNRVFKKYTGKTPSDFSKSNSNGKYTPILIRRSSIKYHTDFSKNNTLVTLED